MQVRTLVEINGIPVGAVGTIESIESEERDGASVRPRSLWVFFEECDNGSSLMEIDCGLSWVYTLLHPNGLDPHGEPYVGARIILLAKGKLRKGPGGVVPFIVTITSKIQADGSHSKKKNHGWIYGHNRLAAEVSRAPTKSRGKSWELAKVQLDREEDCSAKRRRPNALPDAPLAAPRIVQQGERALAAVQRQLDDCNDQALMNVDAQLYDISTGTLPRLFRVKYFRDYFTRLLDLEKDTQQAAVQRRLTSWSIESLQREGFVLLDLEAIVFRPGLKASFGRCWVIRVRSLDGGHLPKHAFNLGSEAIMSCGDDGDDGGELCRGTVCNVSRQMIELKADKELNLSSLETEVKGMAVRLDLGFQRTVYERSRDALDGVCADAAVGKASAPLRAILGLPVNRTVTTTAAAYDPAEASANIAPVAAVHLPPYITDGLNKSQRVALEAASASFSVHARRRSSGQPVVLVHGPPGTGKTFTLSRVCAAALVARRRVLLVAESNAACDNLANGVLEFLSAHADERRVRSTPTERSAAKKRKRTPKRTPGIGSRIRMLVSKAGMSAGTIATIVGQSGGSHTLWKLDNRKSIVKKQFNNGSKKRWGGSWVFAEDFNDDVEKESFHEQNTGE